MERAFLTASGELRSIYVPAHRDRTAQPADPVSYRTSERPARPSRPGRGRHTDRAPPRLAAHRARQHADRRIPYCHRARISRGRPPARLNRAAGQAGANANDPEERPRRTGVFCAARPTRTRHRPVTRNRQGVLDEDESTHRMPPPQIPAAHSRADAVLTATATGLPTLVSRLGLLLTAERSSLRGAGPRCPDDLSGLTARLHAAHSGFVGCGTPVRIRAVAGRCVPDWPEPEGAG